jgi:hypothetical protein
MTEGITLSTISKGIVHAKVDKLLNDRKNLDRNRFIEAVKNWSIDYLDVLKIAGVTDREVEYLREYWFDPNWADLNSECWWREHQPIEPIVRQGLITAIDVATRDPDAVEQRPEPLDVDSYHIYGERDHFESLVTWTDKQVTRIVLTPPHPKDAKVAPRAGPARIKVIKREVVKDDEAPAKRGHERPAEYVDDVKLIEYAKVVEDIKGVEVEGVKVTEYARVLEEAPGSYVLRHPERQKVLPDVKASRLHLVTVRLKDFRSETPSTQPKST